jgi:tetratricopeptide (TPR) repeat protein
VIEVRESINQVQIDLSTGESYNPNAGTVSLAQLTHRVPNSALKLYNSAVKAIRKRDNDDAIDLMEKAVAIDPRFVEAQENWVAFIFKLTAFDQVLKINRRSEIAYVGSSVAFIWLNRYSEAEASARRSLEVNPGSQAGHYFLGISLAEQDKDADEAIQNFKKCSDSFRMPALKQLRFSRAGKSSQRQPRSCKTI